MNSASADLCLASTHGPGLRLGRDRLEVTYLGDGRHSNDVGAIQATRPVPLDQDVFYYEVTVLDAGEMGRIAVGFTQRDFKLTRQPGWEPGSYGYHGDDGRKFHHQDKGEEYGPKFSGGDTIGCCYHLGRQEIFYTKNGVRLKVAFRNVRGALFPTVGLHSKHECVAVNFGRTPFQFDLKGMLADERAALQETLQRLPVPPAALHDAVRSYLSHYAFADTLAAFDQAAGMAGIEEPMSIDSDPVAGSLSLRRDVRRRLLVGDVEGAAALLLPRLPGLMAGEGPLSAQVLFHLNCQQYIELVRQRRIDDAVVFAQTTLAGLRPKLTPANEETLRDIVALIAYEQPASSPLAHFLSQAQREQVADVVNGAVLAVLAGEGRGGHDGDRRGDDTAGGAATSAASAAIAQWSLPLSPPSTLQRLLQQLFVVHDVLRECNGGQGAVFQLNEALNPQP